MLLEEAKQRRSSGTAVHPEQEWVLQSPSSELESERDHERSDLEAWMEGQWFGFV